MIELNRKCCKLEPKKTTPHQLNEVEITRLVYNLFSETFNNYKLDFLNNNIFGLKEQ